MICVLGIWKLVCMMLFDWLLLCLGVCWFCLFSVCIWVIVLYVCLLGILDDLLIYYCLDSD